MIILQYIQLLNHYVLYLKTVLMYMLIIKNFKDIFIFLDIYAYTCNIFIYTYVYILLVQFLWRMLIHTVSHILHFYERRLAIALYPIVFLTLVF